MTKSKGKYYNILHGILISFLIAASFFTYIRKNAFLITSASMEDTIHVGDYIWTKRFKNKKLQRGDILIFRKTINTEEEIIVKRCAALPGDTLFINNGIVSCNSKFEKNTMSIMHTYQLTISKNIPIHQISGFFELPNTKIQLTTNDSIYFVSCSQLYYERIREISSTIGQLSVINRPRVAGHLYPWNQDIASSLDNYGPVIVPKKGLIISLTETNFHWYKDIIELEVDEVQIDGNSIIINKISASEYTFKNDYVFMLGDNRHQSRDSRIYGFIPIEDVRAKATRVMYTILQGKNPHFFNVSLIRSMKKLE